jgi:hypothetical protein
LYEELYIVSAWPMVRMVCAAEVSSACFFSLSICGTARAIRISMMDMTMSSSMRVKPDSRFKVRGAWFVARSVVIMVPLQRDVRFDLV